MTVDLSSLPPEWESIQWDSDESTITAYYTAAPLSTSGTASVNALFTAEGGYLIQKIGTTTFDPPVGSHTKSSISIPPGAVITIPFTLIDSEEETMTGALRFAPLKVEHLWSFEPRLQFADGASPIRFSIKNITTANSALADYSVKGNEGWKITSSKTADGIEGTITSTTPGKGKLVLQYKGEDIDECKDEIAFHLFDIAVSNTDNKTNLAEDRLAGGLKSTPPPHEMDPGGFIIASPKGGGGRSKITITRHPDFSEGQYTVTLDDAQAFDFFNSPTDDTPISFPLSLSPTELTQPKVIYVATKASAASATITPKLTYALPLGADNQTHTLKDEIKISEISADLAVDMNRDGEITFDEKDETTLEKPFRFWVNHDIDDADHIGDPEIDENVVDENPETPIDSADTEIKTNRDLEDFTRIKIKATGVTLDQLRQGVILIGVTGWDPTPLSGDNLPTSPDSMVSIRIWPNGSSNGTADYLANEVIAKQQRNQPCFGNTSEKVVYIPPSYWTDKLEAHLIFEGVKEHYGALFCVIKPKDSTQVTAVDQEILDLLHIRKMFGRGTVENQNPYAVDETLEPDKNPYTNWVEDRLGHAYKEDPNAAPATRSSMKLNRFQIHGTMTILPRKHGRGIHRAGNMMKTPLRRTSPRFLCMDGECNMLISQTGRILVLNASGIRDLKGSFILSVGLHIALTIQCLGITH